MGAAVALCLTAGIATIGGAGAAGAATMPPVTYHCGLAHQNACAIFLNDTVGFSAPGVVSSSRGLEFRLTAHGVSAGAGHLVLNSSGSADSSTLLGVDSWATAFCFDKQETFKTGCNLAGTLPVAAGNELSSSFVSVANHGAGSSSGSHPSVTYHAENVSTYQGSSLNGSQVRESRRNFTRHECRSTVFVRCALVRQGTSGESHWSEYRLTDHLLSVAIVNETPQAFVVTFPNCDHNVPDPAATSSDLVPAKAGSTSSRYTEGMLIPMNGSFSCSYGSFFEDGGVLNSGLNQHFFYFRIDGTAHDGKVKYTTWCESYRRNFTITGEELGRKYANSPTCHISTTHAATSSQADQITATVRP